MNKYVGKICPFCKTAFGFNDEIVICSFCDMPHHKDCWIENKGCTTFGCPGTIKNPDETPSSVISGVMQYYDADVADYYGGPYCGYCGAKVAREYKFCVKCGKPVIH